MTITAYSPSTPARPASSGRLPVLVAALAGAIAVFASAAGWRGGDLSAHLFRVELFREYGMTFFNPQWYGGHFTLSYSVLYPAVAATIGIPLTTVVSVVLASWCFAHLSTRWFGQAGRIGAVLFALGLASPVAIGQLPYLLGVALGLASCVGVLHRRWALAAVLALASTLSSPLAGAFLVLVLVAWAWSVRADRWPLTAVTAAVVVPVGLTALLFPGTGPFPYPTDDALFIGSMMILLAFVVPRRHRALRNALVLYVGAIFASYAISTPMGGNVSRLAEGFGVPLAACVLWPRRRLACLAVVIPLVLWQWPPALPAMTTQPDEPSTHAEYYQELLDHLATLPAMPSRIEVVPTKAHFEVAYVAPTVAIARGWERQVDTAENPLFYGPEPLDAAGYLSWLLRTGTQYVALSDAPLDYAAIEEAAVVRAGVAGLTPVWQGAHWQLFRVDAGEGVLEGPAVLESLRGDDVVLRVTDSGIVRLRLRYNANWRVSPEPDCIGRDADGWIVMSVRNTGTYHLEVGLTRAGTPACS